MFNILLDNVKYLSIALFVYYLSITAILYKIFYIEYLLINVRDNQKKYN